MTDGQYPFVKRGAQQITPGGSMSRIYPVDDYMIPQEVLDHAARFHFIRVPLLGQWNPLARVDNWCGRTSASILWNYHQLAAGRVKSRDDYVSHWRGPTGSGQMNLRFPTGDIAFILPNGEYGFQGQLNDAFTAVLRRSTILPEDADRTRRLQVAEQIRTSLDGQRTCFSTILHSVADNNPVLLYTGFSVSYGGHIVVVCGFCEMPDSDGSLKLWLLIADPAPPKTHKGPMCTPVNAGDEDDCKHLSKLREGKNSLIMLVRGKWEEGRGYLYLLRASKFFERNTFVGNQTLWMDDGCNMKIGGYILHKPSPTPLDPRLVHTKNVISNLCFPLQENPYMLSSPLRYYTRAEAAGTGFYPLGSNQSLHGGVHLPATGSTEQPVKSIAPGYIVAARLSKAPAARPVLEFLNSYNGFVLVRHEIVESNKGAAEPDGRVSTGSTRQGSPRALPFYSLYMHMPPTGWPEMPEKESGGQVDIPWLRRFHFARHGAVVNLDADRGPIGQLVWAASELSLKGETNECEIYEQPQSLAQRRRWKLRDGTRYFGYAKAPPGDLRQGYEALRTGAVVTFSNPFLTVSHGEVLGSIRRDMHLETHGSLHWEVLAPTGQESAVQRVWEWASVDLGLQLPEVSETGGGKDNLLSADELNLLLKDKLPTDDDKRLLKPMLQAIKKKDFRSFKNAMSLFMSTVSTFAEAPDGKEFVKPRSAPTPGSRVARLMQFYTATVKIDNSKYRVQPHGGRPDPYHLTIKYWSGTGSSPTDFIAEASFELTKEQLQQPEIELPLKVPVDADFMEFTSPDFHLDTASSSGIAKESLAKALIPARWRGVVLKHVSEWSLAGLDRLARKLYEEGLLDTEASDADKAVEEVKPVAWYGVPRGTVADLPEPGAKAQPLVEIPVLGRDGQEASLFHGEGAILPANDEVLNVHPVTFVWLLKLLEDAELCRLVTEFEADPTGGSGDMSAEEGARPCFWGWFPHDREPSAVGKPLSVVAIRNDWGQGPVTLVARRDEQDIPRDPHDRPVDSPRELVIAEGRYKDGVFSAQLVPHFWGTWRLEVKGHESASPQLQGGLAAPLTLHIPRPGLTGPLELQKDPRTGLYHAQLYVPDPCPDSLVGYFTYEFVKVTRPSLNQLPQAEHWVLDEQTASAIVDLKRGAKNVTASFALSDYLSASDGKRQVSADLCRAVELFCGFSKTRLRVVSLLEEGRVAVLEAPPKAKLSTLADCATRQANAYDTTIEIREVEREDRRQRRRKVIQLTFRATKVPQPLQWQRAPHANVVFALRQKLPPPKGKKVRGQPPESDTSRQLRLELDPRDVFAQLLREARPTPEERLWLRTTLLAPNGRSLECYEGPSRPVVQAPVAHVDCLQAAVPGVFKTLAWPGFDALRVSIAGHHLVIRAPTRGAKADWAEAAPVLRVDGKPYPVRPSGTGLELKLPLVEVARSSLKIEASITNADALFDGERIAIAPERWEGSTLPVLEGPLEKAEEAAPGMFRLRARVYACPAHASPWSLRCKLLEGPARKKQYPTELSPRRSRVEYGSNLQGEYWAEFPKRHLQPGATYLFELTLDTTQRLQLQYTVPPEDL